MLSIMTNPPPSPQSAEPSAKKNIHYRLTLEEWCQSAKRLKPAELKVLYYLRTLDPFGDRWLDVQVTGIASDLGMNKGTVSRALRVLADGGDLYLEIQAARVRLSFFAPRLSVDNLLSTDNSSCLQTTQVVYRQPELCTDNISPLEPSPEAGSGTPHTIHTYSDSLNKERERPETASPVEKPSEECFALTGEDSLEITTAYEAWLRNKAQKLPSPPVLIEQWIASESLKPSNQRQFLQEMQRTLAKTSLPPPPPDRFQIESAVMSALQGGDRPYAQGKLQQVWEAGHRDMVAEMVTEFTQWGFVMTEQGVCDADG